MSNFIVRNVQGTGVFAIPTTDNELYAGAAALRAILDGVVDLEFQTALTQVIDITPNLPELSFIVDVFTYGGTWLPASIGVFRSAIEASLLAHPSIDSIGNTSINLIEPRQLYTAVPQVARVDSAGGIVHFKDEIPPGAQIEVYAYARKRYGSTHGPYVRNGKRWRPDQLLGVGQLSFNAGTRQRAPRNGRNYFRFAYRWPSAPNTPAPAPGVRGPLSAFSIATANAWERAHSTLLSVIPSPSQYWYSGRS